jgi:3-phosphoshikimate 1-carboxyvinyltransferase
VDILNKYISIQSDKPLSGDYFPPPSKSHSFRALLLSLYSDRSIIYNLLKSDDVDNFVDIINSLGFEIIRNNEKVLINKCKGEFKLNSYYNFKNSGTALRFMVTYFAISKLDTQKVLLDGDDQLKNRKIKTLLDSLLTLGLSYSFKTQKEIPFYIQKKVRAGETSISGKSSQFLSSLLLNLSFLNDRSIIKIEELHEKPYVDMTLFHLNRIGVNIENYNYEKMIINPIKKLEHFEFSVPSDFSSATYIILSSILSSGNINIYNLDLDDTQGDKKILEFIKLLGCDYSYINNVLKVFGDVKQGALFDMNDTPDMLPAIVFFLAQYPYFFEFTNLESIRFKETDRVAVLYENLINMGIKVSMTKDTLSFTGSNNLNNLIIDAHNDHRIIMGASLLGIKKGKKITIKNIKNIDSSYPNYFTDLEKLGAKIKMFHEEH